LSDLITGAVAAVEDKYTLIVNRGETAGVTTGMIFAVLGDEISDPETGELLGHREKLRVKTTEVYERFCRAETYRIISATQILMRTEQPEVTVNIGDKVTQIARQAVGWCR
jgi:hypothetical protein